jgi:hypothetical protein
MLVRSIVEKLNELDLRSMLIRVLEDNTNSGFYENLGEIPFASRTTGIGEARLALIAYGWQDFNKIAL